MEMAGTVAAAASGAMVGVEWNMDIFGVSVPGCSYSCRRRYDPGYCKDYSTVMLTNPVWRLGGYHYFLCGLAFYWKTQLWKGICGLPMTESCW